MTGTYRKRPPNPGETPVAERQKVLSGSASSRVGTRDAKCHIVRARSRVALHRQGAGVRAQGESRGNRGYSERVEADRGELPVSRCFRRASIRRVRLSISPFPERPRDVGLHALGRCRLAAVLREQRAVCRRQYRDVAAKQTGSSGPWASTEQPPRSARGLPGVVHDPHRRREEGRTWTSGCPRAGPH